MSTLPPDSQSAPDGTSRLRASRFYAAVAAVVILAVGGYLAVWANAESDDRRAQQSATDVATDAGAATNDPAASPSALDPNGITSGQLSSQVPTAPATGAGQSPASTTGPTSPPNPSDPLQIAGCGAPPYPKTFEGWTGNPDYTDATKVVYVNGPISNLNRLGYEVSRIAKLGCVSVPMFSANQNDLSAVAWGNAGLFTKEQVIAAMSRIGMASIDTPACHPKCFK